LHNWTKHKPNGDPKWEEKGSEGWIYRVREGREREIGGEMRRPRGALVGWSAVLPAG